MLRVVMRQHAATCRSFLDGFLINLTCEVEVVHVLVLTSE